MRVCDADSIALACATEGALSDSSSTPFKNVLSAGMSVVSLSMSALLSKRHAIKSRSLVSTLILLVTSDNESEKDCAGSTTFGLLRVDGFDSPASREKLGLRGEALSKPSSPGRLLCFSMRA
jgi:hypothetical protein